MSCRRARKRNCRMSGKGRNHELDLEKAAMILLTDFRDGILGRISLETPATRAAMLEAAKAQPVAKETAEEE